MNRKHLVVMVVVALVGVTPAVALASSHITSTPVSKGSADSFRVVDPNGGLRLLLATAPTDVDIRKVTLAAGTATGWHGHHGSSLVIVDSGQLTLTEARGSRCLSETYSTGAAFAHPSDLHNLTNTGGTTAAFHIIYFLPAGSPPAPLTGAQPAACS